MNNEINRKYNFTNKVYVNSPQAYKGKRVIVKIAVGILIAVGLFKILMDGFSFSGLSLIILGVFALMSNLTATGGGLKPVPAELEVDDNRLQLIYESIDREDDKGSRKEIYDIAYNNIKKVEVDRSKGCISIESQPNVEILYSSNKEIHDFKELNKVFTNSLYVSNEILENLISNINNFSTVTIKELG